MSAVEELAAAVGSDFARDPALTFVDTATYGLPPRSTIAALRVALERWESGAADWVEWDRAGDACRALFAELCGTRPETVALVPAVSVAMGIVAASLPAGSTVVVAEGDFTSVLFPVLVAAQRRGITVRTVAFENVAHAVDRDTALVAVSWVHSATGKVIDLDALRAACKASGARLFLDVTQGLGAVPLDLESSGVDYAACAAYKFLLCPRGVGFFYVRDECQHELVPFVAGWTSADSRYGRFYGGPLTLAPDAARFDVSLAWHAWVGARESLSLLKSIDEKDRYALSVRPAQRLAASLELAAPSATIVSVPVEDAEAVRRDVRDASVALSLRAGYARASFHIYNTDADADAAAAVLRPHLRR